jgi:hypothetical protein
MLRFVMVVRHDARLQMKMNDILQNMSATEDHDRVQLMGLVNHGLHISMSINGHAPMNPYA